MRYNLAAHVTARAAMNKATRTAAKSAALTLAALALALSFPVLHFAGRPDAVAALVLAGVAAVVILAAVAFSDMRAAVRSHAYAAALAESRVADREAALRTAEAATRAACAFRDDAVADAKRVEEATARARAAHREALDRIEYFRVGEGAAFAFAGRLAECTPGALEAFAAARREEARALAVGTGGGSLTANECADYYRTRMHALGAVVAQSFPEYTREGAREIAEIGARYAAWPLDAE